ncbi:MAG: rhodanese-like domain-containing protein [Anaerocolumna aminovalerica]|uniref:rhodanese-like domain-containing protein n=1 Tax=Anaerocolumna aminovalerica TaxID=1527 RepID=UPI001C0EB262|nr:rhodanese-like domain-containing protein [Anaerocolumna aminovalerica]MBU5333161.1 rhodanese-like domain-containing protein [Anaerocolumna aminovalerica]MDU6265636.1 rhodanese-like domain-containing protein [Anaerocolumna aminovalerica]
MFGLFKSSNVKRIGVNDMDDLIGKVDLIDIREPYEYKGGALKTAKNIPMMELMSGANRYLNKDRTYYIMCQSGNRSRQCCSVLSKQGYDVVDVTGGYGSYAGSKRK